jgi:hypothetical protein
MEWSLMVREVDRIRDCTVAEKQINHLKQPIETRSYAQGGIFNPTS